MNFLFTFHNRAIYIIFICIDIDLVSDIQLETKKEKELTTNNFLINPENIPGMLLIVIKNIL